LDTQSVRTTHYSNCPCKYKDARHQLVL